MIRVGWWGRAALMLVTMACAPLDALAQPNVGAGPLTSTLPEEEPPTGGIRIGRVLVAPGLVIREIGWDSNVYDEPTDPKEDYVAAVVPDVSAFSRLRFMKLSGYAGVDLQYYKTYEPERNIGHQVRGRADFLLSRVRPFVGGGQTHLRTRPNGEIDTRADRELNELSGGLAFEISPTSDIYGATYSLETVYEDSFEDGVELAATLNRTTHDYTFGLRTELTPLTALTLSGGYLEDVFDNSPQRNAETFTGNATLRFSTDAVISGFVTVGYRDLQPVDPLIRDFRGFTYSAGIYYPFLEIGRLAFTAVRGTEYSFDTEEAYYLENSFTISYTHFLFDEFDAQVRGGNSFYNYGYTVGSLERRDKYDVFGAGVGYNLPNRTRISVNYEYSRRFSAELPDRNYERRRAYLAWSIAF